MRLAPGLRHSPPHLPRLDFWCEHMRLRRNGVERDIHFCRFFISHRTESTRLENRLPERVEPFRLPAGKGPGSGREYVLNNVRVPLIAKTQPQSVSWPGWQVPIGCDPKESDDSNLETRSPPVIADVFVTGDPVAVLRKYIEILVTPPKLRHGVERLRQRQRRQRKRFGSEEGSKRFLDVDRFHF